MTRSQCRPTDLLMLREIFITVALPSLQKGGLGKSRHMYVYDVMQPRSVEPKTYMHGMLHDLLNGYYF